MNAADIIAVVAAAGVELYLTDGALRYRAAMGAYTAELRALVSSNRAAVVETLKVGPIGPGSSPPVPIGTKPSPWDHLNAIGATLPGGYFQLGPVSGDLLRHALDARQATNQQERDEAARRYWAVWERINTTGQAP